MSLHIDRLDITLPASLKGRSGAIQHLLRREMALLDWPTGQWQQLQSPEVSVRESTTNLGIARAMARQLHQSAWQRADGHQQTNGRVES